MPDTTVQGWVETNIYHDYGCTCVTAVLDQRARRVIRPLSAEPLPLARCRADQRLPPP